MVELHEVDPGDQVSGAPPRQHLTSTDEKVVMGRLGDGETVAGLVHGGMGPIAQGPRVRISVERGGTDLRQGDEPEEPHVEA